MREYVLNFFAWWYGVYVRGVGERLVGWVAFTLQYTNTLTMAQNLSRPLFQDNTGVGKVAGFFIRIVWVWIGGMLTVVVAAPLTLLWVVLVILPALIAGQMIYSVISLIT